MVGKARFELARPKAPDSKSGMAAVTSLAVIGATYLCTDGVANHPRFPLPLFNVPSHKLCISHSSLTASHVVRRDSLMTYLGQW